MSRLGLNLPNLISLGRLLLVPLAISLILEDSYWATFWVFVVAGVSDTLDGFIAKRFDRRTRLGALLDPLADKVLLVSKINTGVQVAAVGYVLARLGLGAAPGPVDLVLGMAVAVTTVVSGLIYFVQWVRIIAGSEQAL